jgi:hypothetical protein
VSPEDRAWLAALQKQANANTDAIGKNASAVAAISGALEHLKENIALANVLLAATGTLCGEIASEAEEPHNRLEEILASFESGMEHVMNAGDTPAQIRDRVLAKLDTLRGLAETHLTMRIEQKD